ncbi:hypothetical protein Nepgr_011493 [Nepenthes gracilis]|uniref:Uncharacterized protein n=1 Tax=Nepenthes gracilis TaxID=150966 RepID=A0AAD3SEF2_NEPGR|nr:hypothetical protein Nepgr_011493 [Nepenthes gracilis]
MSSDQLRDNGRAFKQFQDVNFLSPNSLCLPLLPPPVSSTLGVVGGQMRDERKGSQMGCRVVDPGNISAQSFPPLMASGHGGGSIGKELSPDQVGEKQQQGVSFDKCGQPKLCARGHWRPAEDAKLKELVSQFGPQNWNVIAENLEGRSGKSCRLRWFNQLDPRINRRAFTEEEEERLLAAHRGYGNKWAMIARLFPGRTDNAVKNHWHVIMARKHREESCLNYSKRKPSSSSCSSHQPQPLPSLITSCHNNNAAGSDFSTTSSTHDEHATGCTDLSLSISTIKCWDDASIQAQQHQSSASPEGIVMGMEQCGHSDSSSEELSVTNNGQNEDENGKPTLQFFDFLGIGAS